MSDPTMKVLWSHHYLKTYIKVMLEIDYKDGRKPEYLNWTRCISIYYDLWELVEWRHWFRPIGCKQWRSHVRTKGYECTPKISWYSWSSGMISGLQLSRPGFDSSQQRLLKVFLSYLSSIFIYCILFSNIFALYLLNIIKFVWKTNTNSHTFSCNACFIIIYN